MAIGQQREPFRPSIMNTNRQFAFYRYSSNGKYSVCDAIIRTSSVDVNESLSDVK